MNIDEKNAPLIKDAVDTLLNAEMLKNGLMRLKASSDPLARTLKLYDREAPEEEYILFKDMDFLGDVSLFRQMAERIESQRNIEFRGEAAEQTVGEGARGCPIFVSPNVVEA